MSKMSDISVEVQNRLVSGQNPQFISKHMEIPLDWVLSEEANLTLDNIVDVEDYDNYLEPSFTLVIDN